MDELTAIENAIERLARQTNLLEARMFEQLSSADDIAETRRIIEEARYVLTLQKINAEADALEFELWQKRQ